MNPLRINRVRGWRIISTAAAICCCAVVFATDDGGSKPAAAFMVDQLAFLSGSWVNKNDRRATEEHWTSPAGGTMLGMNRTVAGDRTAAFEYLRIERTAEGIDYVAMPSGQPPARFRLIECGDQRAVFENPEHDFPRRIIYQRKGDQLVARIQGERGGKPASVQWSWSRGALSVE